MTDVWSKWEGLTVNGVFPLRLFLGNSDHSVAFLTSYGALNIPDAVIKFLPLEAATADAQLARWKTAATLVHPHLVRIFEAGRCQLGGHPFLFVVMEYADQTLAQVIPRRALAAEEVRGLVRPALEALAFLHRKALVQGQMKPTNVLVINDQVKLASDTIRPAGEPAGGLPKLSAYDAPEAGSGRASAASDIWGLGMTLTEALTQHLPGSPDERPAPFPPDLGPAFAEAIHRCLDRDPSRRPGIAEIEAALSPIQVVENVAPAPAPAPVPFRPPRALIAAALALVVLAAAWGSLRLFRTHPSTQQLPASASASPPASAAAGTAQSASSPAKVVPAVLHQEVPDVPRSARDTIRGRIKITVRVNVDRSGNVVGQNLQSGASKYFDRLASEAARKWKFAPAENPASRAWLLHFEFTREGTTAHAVGPSS
jgi:serine/threonine-protein kinase